MKNSVFFLLFLALLAGPPLLAVERESPHFGDVRAHRNLFAEFASFHEWLLSLGFAPVLPPSRWDVPQPHSKYSEGTAFWYRGAYRGSQPFYIELVLRQTDSEAAFTFGYHLVATDEQQMRRLLDRIQPLYDAAERRHAKFTK